MLPGFDRGVFRANHPGLSSDEENVVFTNELSNIVTGLKAQCSPEKKSILMAHYTVPGCNTESGQTMMLTQFEPIIPRGGFIGGQLQSGCFRTYSQTTEDNAQRLVLFRCDKCHEL